MPTFKPFRGIRPNDEYLDKYPTHPLDNFTSEELLEKAGEPDTYVSMVKPYILSKARDTERNLRKVRQNFDELVESKKLIQDNSCYYLYEQIYSDKNVFRGLLGLTSVEDFRNGKIKRHESTIPAKKEKLAQYLEKVNVQAEPVLLTYPSNPKVELLMNHEEKSVPIINYTDSRGIRHKIWRIDNRLKIQQLKEVLDQIDSFYIADGHHRVGSTALNSKNCQEKNKKHIGNEGYNYIFSFIVSNQSIKIHDYNRIICDLNGLSSEEFLDKLSKYFLINPKKDQPYLPSQKYHMSLYSDGQFYSIHVKHDLRKDQGPDFLDHYLFEKYVVKDILGIQNSDSSDCIKYVKGNSSMESIFNMKKQVDAGEGVAAFAIYPVSFKDMLKISDERISMPPKCTYIEPKLITALIMYDMK